MIERILPNTETKLRILMAIYENPDINLSALIKKSKTSPNIVLKYVNDLIEFDVLKEMRYGGKKKTHIRNLKANLTSNLAVNVFSFVETEKRLIFLKKYKEMMPFFSQLSELVGDKSEFCLVYGSFSRMAADKESDLDIWIVGNLDSEIKKRISEVFSTFKREYSVKIESLDRFYRNILNPLHQNILKDHVIFTNETNYLRIISKVY